MLYGWSGRDSLAGNGGQDTLSGLYDNDTLDGGAGDDALHGGSGSDTYVFAKGYGHDYISEGDDSGRDGNDQVLFSGLKMADVNFQQSGDDLIATIVATGETLTIQHEFNGDTSWRVESLKFTDGKLTPEQTLLLHQGTTDDDIVTGGIGNDSIYGYAGNDILIDNTGGNDSLDGGTGIDIMMGGTGNDAYVVDTTDDVAVEKPAEGNDTVQTSVTYALPANVENLALTGAAAINGTGNSLKNTLTGNGAANLLDGGAGADTFKGGKGDDTYLVDNTGDTVTENASEGSDTVQSSVTYALPANVEKLILTGTANINATGNSLANVLTGNGGNNTLDGGTGADRFAGGAGNDTYTVDSTDDVVTENANEGADTVKSSINYNLPANVENLVLTGAVLNGTGNSLANQITGNSANNSLAGDAGNDTLNGQGGNDTLVGGLGDDTYLVDSTGDMVVEEANAGTDTVQSSVTYTLPANVENLTLTGADTLNGTGNTLANILVGNAAANVLTGGKGADILTGGGGADTFVLGSGSDKVLDFLSGTDKLQLPDAASGLLIGNGNHIVDAGVSVAGPGGFSDTAELVIVTQNIAGAITTASAAAAIGSASAAYAAGNARLFAVDNGTDSALFLFKSAGADATVGATELTLIGTLQGTAATTLADYAFA